VRDVRPEVSESVTGTRMITLPPMPAGGPEPDGDGPRRPGRHSVSPAPAAPAGDDGDDDGGARRARMIRLGLLALLVAAALGIALAFVINGSLAPTRDQSANRIPLPPQERAAENLGVPATAAPATSAPKPVSSPPKAPASAAPRPLSSAAPSPFRPELVALSAAGLGPFHVGAPVSALLSAGVAIPDSGGQCGGTAVVAADPQFTDPATGRRLSAHVSGGRISYVTVWTPAHRVLGGLGVGSVLGQLMGSSATAEQYGDSVAGSVIVKDASGGGVLFALRGGAARAMVAGPVGELRRIAEQASRQPGNLALLC
jgi:hypothetical protein